MVLMSSDSSTDIDSFSLETECPESLFDCDFSGKHEDAIKVCYHRQRVIKLVAFEGTDTGRRYLGCGVEGANCGYVKFVDQEWSGSLKKALLKLWTMYDQCKYEKKQIEQQLKMTLMEKDKAVDAMIQKELQTADVIGDYKLKTDEAKIKLKKFRKHVKQNDNHAWFAVCATMFLVGLLLGVWCTK